MRQVREVPGNDEDVMKEYLDENWVFIPQQFNDYTEIVALLSNLEVQLEKHGLEVEYMFHTYFDTEPYFRIVEKKQ